MMSSPVSTAADAPAAPPAATGDPGASALDGWRRGGLPALRSELDRIDDALHDLLMQRAEIVEQVARSGKPAAFRPGREASIIRRLLARHHGALPPVTLVRIWRELLAGTTSMQGRFSLAVGDPDQGATLTHLAQEHFGVLTPLLTCASADQALAAVSQGDTSIAVLPYPSDRETWWVALPRHEPRLHVIARLPFWQPRPAGVSTAQALVVAATPPDASELDRSLLGLECDPDVNAAQLSQALSAAGLKPETLLMVRAQGAPMVNVLVETPGALSDDDPRLGRLHPLLRRPIVLGSYAVPVAGPAQ